MVCVHGRGTRAWLTTSPSPDNLTPRSDPPIVVKLHYVRSTGLHRICWRQQADERSDERRNARDFKTPTTREVHRGAAATAGELPHSPARAGARVAAPVVPSIGQPRSRVEFSGRSPVHRQSDRRRVVLLHVQGLYSHQYHDGRTLEYIPDVATGRAARRRHTSRCGRA
jgi:hypothetical protein